MTTPTEGLRERAAGLRTEAFRLLEGGGVLDAIRDGIGPVEVVGSVDLDLLVWPDIDLYTRLGPDEGQRLLALLSALHKRMGREGHAIVRASFNDEYRRPGNPYARGLYCGLQILPARRERVWKVDLWAWDEATFADKMAEHRRLATELARVDRDLVLQIKDAIHLRREYRDTLTSMDVYAFAIQDRGRTVREFEEFVAGQGRIVVQHGQPLSRGGPEL
jgi:hypothetical protein